MLINETSLEGRWSSLSCHKKAYEANTVPLKSQDTKIKYIFNAIGPRGNFAGDGMDAHVTALKSLADFAENILKK